jgi:imidazolonepropionase-like amidohydrolase
MRAFAIVAAALLLLNDSFNGGSAQAQVTAEVTAQVTALTNATLIDGSGAAPQSGVTIVMQGGRITAIGRDAEPPAGAGIVDLSGKYVVPGIINGHGHVGPAPHERQVRQYALYGVTTTTSMASDPDAIAEYKARTRAGDIRGARVLTVMYRFTTMQAPGAGYDYRTPEAARGKVDEIAAKGADVLKVWIDPQGGKVPRLSREMVTAIVDQGRKHNLITGAHIVELADANMVIDEGVRILLHNVRDQEVGNDFITRLKDRNITVISTLAREEGMFAYGNEGPGFTDNPFFTKSVPPERMAVLTGKIRETQAKMPGRDRAIRAFETDKKNLKRMVDAGARFGFGTDSGGDPNRFFVQGFFEHRQMELMVQAGLTPMQVIQAFSKNNAEAYGIQKDYGTLALGKAADLLVLTKNPLDDILNMRALEAVYIGGRKFE